MADWSASRKHSPVVYQRPLTAGRRRTPLNRPCCCRSVLAWIVGGQETQSHSYFSRLQHDVLVSHAFMPCRSPRCLSMSDAVLALAHPPTLSAYPITYMALLCDHVFAHLTTRHGPCVPQEAVRLWLCPLPLGVLRLAFAVRGSVNSRHARSTSTSKLGQSLFEDR